MLFEEDLFAVLEVLGDASLRTGECISLLDRTCFKSTRLDLQRNRAVLEIVCKHYPTMPPSVSLLARVFRRFDDQKSNNISQAKNKQTQRVWADGEARKLKTHIGYLRQLSRRSAGSAEQACFTPTHSKVHEGTMHYSLPSQCASGQAHGSKAKLPGCGVTEGPCDRAPPVLHQED